MPVSMRRIAALSAIVLGAAGCTTTDTTPANQRGFFSGIGAAVTGADEKRASTLEATAAQAEARNRQLSARVDAANQQAAITSGQVRAAEQRLANIQAEVRRQRERLNALQTGGTAPAAEVGQLKSELDAIDAERRSAAASSSAISPAKLQNLEDRAKAVNVALARLGAV